MFGYVLINQGEMKFKDYDIYHSYYCGLCRSLYEAGGRKSQLSLSYDMTFLVMALTAIYELEPEEKYCRCIAHPAKKHLERKNEKKREEEGKEDRTNINSLMGRVRNKILELFTSSPEKIKTIYNRIISRGIKDTYPHDLNRPRIIWNDKRFIGKFRYNQRRNV